MLTLKLRKVCNSLPNLFYAAVPIIFYGLQHYLSLAGSLIFIPLIIIPAMGGTDVSIYSGILKLQGQI